jgi:DNA (cytosine-5)-methyltransferase 1
MGYSRAGFGVVGVDIKPQPNYPFEFWEGDALACLCDDLGAYDAIHASPPCQRYSSATKAWHREDQHADLYDETRARLIGTGLPWAIENVTAAPSHSGVVLCGSMFGLDVERHRTFETSHLILLDRHCKHSGRSLTVTGHSPYWWDGGKRTQATVAEINEAMGIDWMSRREIVQAVPPAYTEWVGAQLMVHLEASVASGDG